MNEAWARLSALHKTLIRMSLCLLLLQPALALVQNGQTITEPFPEEGVGGALIIMQIMGAALSALFLWIARIFKVFRFRWWVCMASFFSGAGLLIAITGQEHLFGLAVRLNP